MLNSGKVRLKGQHSLRGVDGSSDETNNRTCHQVVHQARRVILYHESGLSNFSRIANGTSEPSTFGFGSIALTWWMQPKYPPFHQKCLKTSEYRSKRGDNTDTHLHMVASIPAYKPANKTFPRMHAIGSGIIQRTEQTLAPHDLLHDVDRPSELTRLVLKPGSRRVQPRTNDVNKRRHDATHLILTSSNGTTTKLSVAPAAHPVAIASGWSIFFRPVSARNCLPQKSFAALRRDGCGVN